MIFIVIEKELTSIVFVRMYRRDWKWPVSMDDELPSSNDWTFILWKKVPN